MEEELKPCNVGLVTKTENQCHLKTYSSVQILHSINSFSTEEVRLLRFRIDNYFSLEDTICSFHKYKYLDYFSSYMSKCCDPFKMHKKSITGSNLRSMSLRFCNETLNKIMIKLKPGDKICVNCENKIIKIINLENEISAKEESNVTKATDLVAVQEVDEIDQEVGPSISQLQPPEREKRKSFLKAENLIQNRSVTVLSGQSYDSTSAESSSIYTTRSDDLSKIDNITEILGIPPFKKLKLSKNKLETKSIDLVQTVCNKLSKKISSAFDVNISTNEINFKDLQADSLSFKQLIENLQKNFQSTKYVSEKLFYLALLPKDWSYTQILKYFDCSYYMYNQLQKYNYNVCKYNFYRI